MLRHPGLLVFLTCFVLAKASAQTSAASAASARQALSKVAQGQQALLSVNSKGNKDIPCPEAAAQTNAAGYDSMNDLFRDGLHEDPAKAAPAAPAAKSEYDKDGLDKNGFVRPACDPKADGENGAPVCTVDEKTATMLFDKLRRADKLLRLDNPRLDVCKERAQVASYRLRMNYGVTTGKIWVKDWRGMSPQLDGEKGRSGTWSYHVASYVIVKRNGKDVRLVMDPIVDRSRPLTEDEWKARISASPGSLSTTYGKACAYKFSQIESNCTGAGMNYNDAVKCMNGHENNYDKSICDSY